MTSPGFTATPPQLTGTQNSPAKANALGGHGRKTAAPKGNAVLADLADVGRDAVDDHAGQPRDLASVRDQAAERRVAVIARAVDYQHVTAPHLAEGITDDRPIHAGGAHRHRRAGDAHVALHGADARVHEPRVAEVTDGRRFCAHQFFDQLPVE
jgi:hypothetical protein